MINYAFLFYLPGAAGNFFSRCLALANDQAYGWIPKTSLQPKLTIDEKYQAYSYEKSCQYNNWIEFETKLMPYNELFAHHEIPAESISIWSSHPRYSLIDKVSPGIDDAQHVFYINPEDNFEWVLLNCLYKNSFIDVKWLREGNDMEKDSDIHQISLTNIINGPDTLWLEIKKIYAIINHKCSNKELVQSLWQQWIKTTLKPEQFQEFKSSIGFRI